MKKTFEPGKNAKELGIVTTRPFVVIKPYEFFHVGEIVVLTKDDDTQCPFFRKKIEQDYCFFWSHLAYADEPEDNFEKNKEVNRMVCNHSMPSIGDEPKEIKKPSPLIECLDCKSVTHNEDDNVCLTCGSKNTERIFVFGTTTQKLSKIIEWLYVNDGGYKSKIEWREALIKMLKETL